MTSERPERSNSPRVERARCRAIVTREGLFIAYVAPLQDSPTMLAYADERDPEWAPHRYADLHELREGERIEQIPAVPILDAWVEGTPVVAIPFSEYELANLGALCEVLMRYNAFNTGDWMICYRDRIPAAVKQFASSREPNLTAAQMDERLIRKLQSAAAHPEGGP